MLGMGSLHDLGMTFFFNTTLLLFCLVFIASREGLAQMMGPRQGGSEGQSLGSTPGSNGRNTGRRAITHFIYEPRPCRKAMGEMPITRHFSQGNILLEMGGIRFWS